MSFDFIDYEGHLCHLDTEGGEVRLKCHDEPTGAVALEPSDEGDEA